MVLRGFTLWGTRALAYSVARLGDADVLVDEFCRCPLLCLLLSGGHISQTVGRTRTLGLSTYRNTFGFGRNGRTQSATCISLVCFLGRSSYTAGYHFVEYWLLLFSLCTQDQFPLPFGTCAWISSAQYTSLFSGSGFSVFCQSAGIFQPVVFLRNSVDSRGYFQSLRAGNYRRRCFCMGVAYYVLAVLGCVRIYGDRWLLGRSRPHCGCRAQGRLAQLSGR